MEGGGRGSKRWKHTVYMSLFAKYLSIGLGNNNNNNNNHHPTSTHSVVISTGSQQLVVR